MIPSETAKCRAVVAPYCVGNGLDLGSGGDPVIPQAIQIEKLRASFECQNYHIQYPVQWRGTAEILPFKDSVCDYVFSSHVLEDFKDWMPLLIEWDRVLVRGGYLIIQIPDHERFRAAVRRGQPDNLDHQHEGRVGELSEHVQRVGNYEVIRDGFCPDVPGEYNILFVARKR